ncbi:MAG: ABC transporter permease [Myxococcota bacterium]
MTPDRLLAIAYKEWLHLRRDPRSIALAIGAPAALVILFGFAIGFDLEQIPIAVVDHAGSSESRRVLREVFAPGELVCEGTYEDAGDALSAMRSGEVAAVLVVAEDFSTRARRPEHAGMQLLVDGGDSTTATSLVGKADAITSAIRQTPSQSVMRRLSLISAFNPAGVSALFIVPGLAAYVLALVAVLLTALTIAREFEAGSMEQLLATPVSKGEIIVGKLLPYVGLGAAALSLVLLTGYFVFDVPFRGSFATLVVASALFLTGMLGQGLLVSTIARNQMVATQVALMTSLLPSMLLSGFLFPIENMPAALQAITTIVPARYFIEVLRGVLLRGSGFEAAAPEIAALLVFAALMLMLSVASFRREAS